MTWPMPKRFSRGRPASHYAVCGPQEREPAGRRRRVPHAGSFGSPTHPGHQCAPRSLGRVRGDRRQRAGPYLQAHRCPRGSRLRSAPSGAGDPSGAGIQAARGILAVLVEELRSLDERVAVLDREIARHATENSVARRLMTIPGIGAVTAAALTALAPPAETFRRGRDFAAWLGLTPVQRSSGGKERLGKTSKMGERSLRRLLIIGASAV